jgi:hypothetical protein
MQSIGTATSQYVYFNTGYLTINANQIVDVQDVTITNSFAAKDFRALNSIIKRAIKRATLDQSIKCTVVGYNSAIWSLFFSSSSPISGGNEYNVKDGQQNTTTCYLTVYRDDDSSKKLQFQVTNPVFTSNSINAPTEDFGKLELEIQCTEIKVDTATSAE